MKNIINEIPPDNLDGRLLISSSFVQTDDIKNKNVLDVGCGYGWFEKYALKNAVKKVCGIEVTSNDLKTAKNYVKDKRCEFKIGSALEIPYPNNFFDTIVCWDVIEHIPKNTEEKMFREINRVLKKKGTFYMSTPNSNLLSTFGDPAWWLIGHRHYTLKALNLFGQKVNFKISNYLIWGKIWILLSTLNLYISKWIFKRSMLWNDFFVNQVNRELSNKGYMFIILRYVK
jgi:ubiquinone/menaquinone biosynthesis C-methylase UbiE